VIELLVAVAELGDVMHRGTVVAPDHPLVVAQPSLFTRYDPPVPLTADGSPVGPKAVVARESFATGDVVVRRGELFDRKAEIVRRAPTLFVPFNPPTPRSRP
jgi:hypothetical protein